MSIAEKWLRNYWPDYESMVPQTMSTRLLLEYLDTVANSALELAAQEAEKFVGKPCVASHVAFRIRALKSPAGPVQPSQEPSS